jgi:lysophospholipase L1-like esterase
MAGGWRAKRESLWAFLGAALVVIGTGAGVGAVVVAAADGGSPMLPVHSPVASGMVAPGEASGAAAAASPSGARKSSDPNLGTEAGTRTSQDQGVPYVALGDSYASGQGGGDYDTGDEDGECRHSAAGYPALLNAEPGIRLVADLSCGGDTTEDLLDTQMDDLNEDTRLVTITIGGNDLGAIRVAAVCSLAPSSPDCRSMLLSAWDLLAPGGELERRLRTTFAEVRADAPNARIVVTGYPNLFEGPGTSPDSEVLISTLRTATESLNADIEAAVVAERRSGSDIAFADVTEAFAGHGAGAAEPWIHSSGSDMFHPRSAGYVAYADAIRAALSCDETDRDDAGAGADQPFCF